eukprot:CAMPEP_0202372730 /NCGR_PEP_ID=MMETSP1127-20130417/3874_1 /ASSEMBLY_ACC=CAM_ASM_000462 /TAXON_ID=3047 /ORGANISM="Dunaliella tertiolecta, Strain CCMP1320" /LENGTH=125 /DNA_ID=CAMNT_0048969365 /DNA_START=277 /DNA_END=653 /DNA_ORIENTATION=+
MAQNLNCHRHNQLATACTSGATSSSSSAATAAAAAAITTAAVIAAAAAAAAATAFTTAADLAVVLILCTSSSRCSTTWHPLLHAPSEGAGLQRQCFVQDDLQNLEGKLLHRAEFANSWVGAHQQC